MGPTRGASGSSRPAQAVRWPVGLTLGRQRARRAQVDAMVRALRHGGGGAYVTRRCAPYAHALQPSAGGGALHGGLARRGPDETRYPGALGIARRTA
eukprot:7956614-Pyramimonas_sp.AAC.1